MNAGFWRSKPFALAKSLFFFDSLLESFSLEEKEEEPHEAVAVAVKANSVEDVKLGRRQEEEDHFSYDEWTHSILDFSLP